MCLKRLFGWCDSVEKLGKHCLRRISSSPLGILLFLNIMNACTAKLLTESGKILKVWGQQSNDQMGAKRMNQVCRMDDEGKMISSGISPAFQK